MYCKYIFLASHFNTHSVSCFTLNFKVSKYVPASKGRGGGRIGLGVNPVRVKPLQDISITCRSSD